MEAPLDRGGILPMGGPKKPRRIQGGPGRNRRRLGRIKEERRSQRTEVAVCIKSDRDGYIVGIKDGLGSCWLAGDWTVELFALVPGMVPTDKYGVRISNSNRAAGAGNTTGRGSSGRSTTQIEEDTVDIKGLEARGKVGKADISRSGLAEVACEQP